MGPGLSIIEARPQVAAIAAGWRDLAESEANAFITPEWFEAGLDAYGESSTPFVVSLNDSDGAVAALAPLVREGKGTRSVLRFGGSSVGDLFSLPAIDEPSRHELSRLIGELLARRRDWGSLVLENVLEGSTWVDELGAAGLSITRLPHRDEVLPFTSIEGQDWEEFFARKSRNFRRQFRRKTRALERDHEVEFRLVEDPDRLPAAMDTFERLHHARWDGRGGSQALTAKARHFHGRFAASALEQGWLRLWLMIADSQEVAAWYGWRIGDRYAYYLAGFDPAWSRESVGLLLQTHTVRAAIEEDAAIYDMLLGGEEFKSRFADSQQRVCTYVIARKLSSARLMARAEVFARKGMDRLSPELRARVKKRVGWLARRAPADVRR